jgi:hypothetical protein
VVTIHLCCVTDLLLIEHHRYTLLELKHDDRNCSFCSSMRIRTGYNVDQIIFAVIEHEDKTNRSRPKAVLADLQLIEHDGHNPSAADLQLIRAEHLPNGRCSPSRAHRQYNEARSRWNAGIE